MSHQQTTRFLAFIVSAAMILGGILLALRAFNTLPSTASTNNIEADLQVSSTAAGQLTQPPLQVAQATTPEPIDSARASGSDGADDVAQIAEETPTTAPTPAIDPIRLAISNELPGVFADRLLSTTLSQPHFITTTSEASMAEASIQFDFSDSDSESDPVHTFTFAAASRFDTIDTGMTLESLQQTWQGRNEQIETLLVLSDTLPSLTRILGPANAIVGGVADMESLIAGAWSDRMTLVIVPFDLLDPRLVVHALDGQNPVENATKFDADAYPLTITIHARGVNLDPAQRGAYARLRLALGAGNRQADRLTVLAMTGVTAMVRHTAAKMDKYGAGWPAEVIGAELTAADITHISNEVPFIPDCETNEAEDNLTFCSKPEYLEALYASGVDIVGLTGNHQNDFGQAGALASLEIYAQAGIPVYGGGRNKEAAFAPYLLEHNGNRLAFIGANSYGPAFAWATDNRPGSAEFDLSIMSAMIRNLKESDRADLVLAELQYRESYYTYPPQDQRWDFEALVLAGADIVTGVQSHVPQALDFHAGGAIFYGLGNLYFDQMWSEQTREGLILKHTFYEGRHISTQLLTTLLYEYGQPRWASDEERSAILERVFGASFP